MLKTWIAPAAAALAVLLLAGTVETAEAKKGGGGWSGGGARFSSGKVYGGGKFYGGSKFYGGPKVYGGKVYHGNHGNKFARFHQRHRFVGVPLAYGYSDSYGCYWLRRRALDSGSSYWWNRYYACLDGDYYD